MELALAAQEITMWQVALGLGVVVLLVVVALLSALMKIIRNIDQGVKGVWETATRVAANTATTWQLKETASTLEEIKREALRHDELLSRS